MDDFEIWDAVAEGDPRAVEMMVESDPDLLEARDEEGNTPLMCAAGGGHVEIVRWLLDEGAATNEQNTRGSTAVYWASWAGCTPAVRLLLEKGADATITSHDGWTCLITASVENCLDTVKCLLADPSALSVIDHRAVGQDGATAMRGWRGR
jgi:uncharacterized protein